MSAESLPVLAGSQGPLNVVLTAVQERISSIWAEIQVLDRQFDFLGVSPGTTHEDLTQFVLYRNIKATIHDLFIRYSRKLAKVAGRNPPLQQLISCHLFVLQQTKFQILLQELFGQQSALTTLVGED
jgi:hypothetical protein